MIVTIEKLEFSKPIGFIVLEGLNGSGKSTLATHICDLIKKSGKDVCRTFEPGATQVGQSIRQIVLGQTCPEKKLTSLAELLLFSADRNLHIEQVVRPALKNGSIVVCDRYFYSTLAFQGYGRGYPLRQIEDLSIQATDGLLPDLVLLLDIAPETGLARTRGRLAGSDNTDSFEDEDLDFHARLRNGFMQIAENRTEQFVVLDANQDLESIKKQAGQAVIKLIQRMQSA